MSDAYHRIDAFLDTMRPALISDGGDVEVVAVDRKSGIVRLRLTGACAHCSISHITLRHFLERELKKKFPFIKQIIAENEDHNIT